MVLGNMDNGLTLQGEAGRTHPDYQATGFMTRYRLLTLLYLCYFGAEDDQLLYL